MSIKENLQAVKEELSTEEQFLEGMIKTERFFKRYKMAFIALVMGAVIVVAGFSLQEMFAAQRIQRINAAYAILQKNPSDTAAIETLKTDAPELYTLLQLRKALQEGDVAMLSEIEKGSSALASDVARYQLFGLQEGGTVPNSDLFAGLVALHEGHALLKAGKIAEAKAALARIEANSPLKQIAQNLEHYQGITKP